MYDPSRRQDVLGGSSSNCSRSERDPAFHPQSPAYPDEPFEIREVAIDDRRVGAVQRSPRRCRSRVAVQVGAVHHEMGGTPESVLCSARAQTPELAELVDDAGRNSSHCIANTQAAALGAESPGRRCSPESSRRGCGAGVMPPRAGRMLLAQNGRDPTVALMPLSLAA